MQSEQFPPVVNIYTDGGAEPNPGKGGFGVIMTFKEHKKEFSQGFVLTTNNRMELSGVIFGLEKLKKVSIVNVFTDSQYVVNGISKGWAHKWKKNNWFRTKTEKASNYDLWDKLLTLISSHQSVTFHWVKGHAGHTENERCDQLAEIALNGKDLLEDIGYIPTMKTIPEVDNTELTDLTQVQNKIRNEGDSCRKCNKAVIKKQTKKKVLKPDQEYYFDYYLLCPSCKTMYMVEEAKRFGSTRQNELFS